MFSTNDNLLANINPCFPIVLNTHYGTIDAFMKQAHTREVIVAHEKLFPREFISYYVTTRDRQKLITLVCRSNNYRVVLNAADSAIIWYITTMVPLLDKNKQEFLSINMANHSITVVKHILTYPLDDLDFEYITQRIIESGNLETFTLLHQHGVKYDGMDLAVVAIATGHYDILGFLVKTTPEAADQFKKLAQAITDNLI